MTTPRAASLAAAGGIHRLGLRRLRVVAGAGSGAGAARGGPPLLLGGTVFVQGHVLLGYLLGPAADAAFERARTPLLVGLAVLVVAGAVLWLVRRRGRVASE